MDRLDDSCYVDRTLNVLAQDFIYSVTKYLDDVRPPGRQWKEPKITEGPLLAQSKSISFHPSFLDHVNRQRTQTRLGYLVEEFVLQYERRKLGPGLAARVEHHSRSLGDGLGYDILSVANDGSPLYIEVKTTTGGLETPFYVSAVELARSKQDRSQFALYRVYNFDNETLLGDVHIIRGDLSSYCVFANSFEVRLRALQSQASKVAT